VARDGARVRARARRRNLELLPRAILALVSALRGEDDEARRQAEDAYERGTAHGFPVPVTIAIYALAFLDLGRGRWTSALHRFGSLADEQSGVADPFLATISAPDRLEAAVRTGRIDQAREALALFEEWATQAGAPWAGPHLASCRALLADGDEATGHFEDALRLRADARPFDLARIRLLHGEHLRRERRPSEARRAQAQRRRAGAKCGRHPGLAVTLARPVPAPPARLRAMRCGMRPRRRSEWSLVPLSA
jgi:hypothetical protein